jgi:predicted CoA-binding protein
MVISRVTVADRLSQEVSAGPTLDPFRRGDPMPTTPAWRNPPDAELIAILEGRPVIALVGASARPDRPSHEVMAALIGMGYEVIPVNPNEREVQGRVCYPSLRELPKRVDLVDVFRRPEETPPIARDAVAIGARVLWMQLGVVNPESARIAQQGGLTVVMDRCLIVEHHRLIGRRHA